MIGVIDYGAGNIGNVLRACQRIGAEARFLHTPWEAKACDLLILPGVGAFPPAMERLQRAKWSGFLTQWAHSGNPLVGICLGMQLLCECSHEGDQTTAGLGLIEGSVSPLRQLSRLPHMGWNTVSFSRLPVQAQELRQFNSSYFYFIHSYALDDSSAAVASTTVEGTRFVSAVQLDNIWAFQFHPERSGAEGLSFLRHVIQMLGKPTSVGV